MRSTRTATASLTLATAPNAGDGRAAARKRMQARASRGTTYARDRTKWGKGPMGKGTRGACLLVAIGVLLATPSVAAAQAGPPPDSEFEKVTLNDFPGEPMDLAVLPDGRVLHTTRPGQLWLHDPATGRNRIVNEFNVY